MNAADGYVRTATARDCPLALVQIGIVLSAATLRADLPDPGLPAPHPGMVTGTTLDDVPVPGARIQIYHTATGLDQQRFVVLVNGNGFVGGGPLTPNPYQALATHLATHGFITAILRRPGAGGGGGSGTTVIDAIDATLQHLYPNVILSEVPVVLVGHSHGYAVAVEAINDPTISGKQFAIAGLAALAPRMDESADNSLNQSDVPNLLFIYGSQDEDVDLFDPPVNEAFRAYDQAGVGLVSIKRPRIDKTMVYIYGADHAGLIGSQLVSLDNQWDLEYVTPSDQLYLVKAWDRS